MDETAAKLKTLDKLVQTILKEEAPIRESYYLNNWYRYKKNIKDLEATGLSNAKRLFKALKELSTEDRNFLATKYDRPTIERGLIKAHPSDQIVADELDMEASEYTKQRRAVQKKLKLIMQEHSDKERMDKYERIQNIN
ncbi:hypothetical protein [Lacticigenium naphthae]|uniref:hypothetical protein n=1 Tax=Lacticigenium naphthae TaxID=515351 RepID=UPI0003FBDA9B|nr:hypothetical protein [Lacticigenium naphthae]